MDGVRRWWQEIAGLVLPAECAGCGRARTALCPRCRGALLGNRPRRVRPEPEPAGLPAVHAAAPYADEIRAVLLAHKERGGLGLTGVLGVAVAGAVRVGLGEAGVGEGEGPPPPAPLLLLVPVPSAPAATRARGHDPARRIALAAAGELRRAGVRARVAPVLRQRGAVADQTGLNARERQENLVGALAVVRGGGRLLCGGAVVLVDDLMTTGASLAEAARAVRAATAAEPPGRAQAHAQYGTTAGCARGVLGVTGPGVQAVSGATGVLGVQAVLGVPGLYGADGVLDATGYPGAHGVPGPAVRPGPEGGSYPMRGRPEDGPGPTRIPGPGDGPARARDPRPGDGPARAGDPRPEEDFRGGRGGSAVYLGDGREGRGVRRFRTAEGGAGVARGGDVLCAAVVAASPDSFVINRN